jgi:hypothetical protein
MTNPQGFDHHQFAGKHTHPVNARMTVDGWLTPGVAFEDYSRMSTQTRKTSGERRLPTPLWAMNNPLLRKVLVQFMEERAFSKKERTVRHGAQKDAFKLWKGTKDLRTKEGRAIYAAYEDSLLKGRLEAAKAKIACKRPAAMKVMDGLCQQYVEIRQKGLKPGMTDAEWNASSPQPYMEFAEGEARYQDEKHRLRQLEIEIEGIDTYLRYTENGGADVVAAVVYLYYRTGLDSVGVGAELGLKPPHVRQTLWRLHQTAKRMAEDGLLSEVPPKKKGKKTAPATKGKLASPPLF